MRSLLVSLVIAVVTTSCASAPAVVKRDKVPRGVEIAVIAFRDCLIANQEDCSGSGSITGSVVARALFSGGQFKAFPVSRPVGATQPLADDEAVALGREKRYAYVINGEVDDYYIVAPMTFRSEKAGISMRLLRVSDGALVAFFSRRREAGNLTTPDKMILKMAGEFRDALLQP